MEKLNLPGFNYKLKKDQDSFLIFDPVRKKYIKLTPEEWVRQHFVNFLTQHLNYPASRIGIEKQINVLSKDLRADIVVFDEEAKPYIVVECKAPSIKLTYTVLEQIARYNLHYQSRFLVITNGIEHFFFKLDYESRQWLKQDILPEYKTLSKPL